MRTPQGYHHYYTDQLGSPQALMRSNQALTWRAEYSAFGRATVMNPQDVTNPEEYPLYPQPLRFPGQYADFETGLHQNLMRDYDPLVGGYLEQDPYGVMLTGPNRHGYALGDPLMWTDPTGEAVPVILIVAGIFWLDYQIQTGFPVYKCALALWDPCVYAAYEQDCYQELLGVALGVGIGRVVGYLGAAIAPAVGRAVGPRLAPVLGRLMRPLGRVPWRAAEQYADDAARAMTATETSVSEKLSKYLLNPNHPVGGPKAKWFQEALGFGQSNADDLARQIVFDPSKAVQTAVTQYGTKFNQVIPITGTNGRVIDVTFAWIRNKNGVVRLITGIPTKP